MTAGRLHWLIGHRGLIGSSVSRQLDLAGGSRFDAPPIDWSDKSDLALLDSLTVFARTVERRRSPWSIIWCAGKAVPSSSPAACRSETARIDRFLSLLQKSPLRFSPGAVVFTSSAGGIHAGSQSATVCEWDPPTPTTPYGIEKVLQEKLVETAARELAVPWHSARVSTVYGPGQDLTKSQGLITKLCASTITGSPVTLSVGYDTQRDFIHVDDVGRSLAALAGGTVTVASGPIFVASGTPVSIGAIVGALRRLRPFRQPVLRLTPPHTPQTDGHFVYRSIHTALTPLRRVNLHEGLDTVLKSLTTAHNRVNLVSASA